MRKQFQDTVTELAEMDDKVVVVLGDISHFLFMPFQEKYPTRCYNMGICENALVSITAGLSSQGFHPFVHTITPFITERCVEQIKVDLCYNQFGGNIVSTGASFDYAWDGATHHAYTELAILRMLPGMEVPQPGNRKELDMLIRSQYNNGKPTYFRLSDHGHKLEVPVKFGKANILKDSGAKVTVMTAGPILGNVMEACQDLPVNLVYFTTIKPIDKEVIERSATRRSGGPRRVRPFRGHPRSARTCGVIPGLPGPVLRLVRHGARHPQNDRPRSRRDPEAGEDATGCGNRS